MTGCTRAEVDRLKAFISRIDDGGIRLAYRRNPEPLPRRSVLVGSTNDFHCLPNDATGNRRFLPIMVVSGDVTAIRSWLDENRVQTVGRSASPIPRRRTGLPARRSRPGTGRGDRAAPRRRRRGREPGGQMARPRQSPRVLRGRDRGARCRGGRPSRACIAGAGRTHSQCPEGARLRARPQALGRRQESRSVLSPARLRQRERAADSWEGYRQHSCRVEGRRVAGRGSVACPALSRRAAVRHPWARFPPMGVPCGDRRLVLDARHPIPAPSASGTGGGIRRCTGTATGPGPRRTR